MFMPVIVITTDKDFANIMEYELVKLGLAVLHGESVEKFQGKKYSYKHATYVIDQEDIKGSIRILDELEKANDHISSVFVRGANKQYKILTALLAGAFHYITPDQSIKETVWRIWNNHKKCSLCLDMNFSNKLTINFDARMIICAGEIIVFSRLEVDVLKCLYTKLGACVSKEEIAEFVYRKELKSNSVAVAVHKIRARLKNIPGVKITNVYRKGFCMEIAS